MKDERSFSIELDKGNKYKQKYLLNKLKKYLDLSKSSILEIGIGYGKFGFLLADKFKDYCGIDINQEYVKIAKTNIPKNTNVTYKLGNAEDIPFDNKFDIIFYSLSWHFIEDQDKALKEAERLLKQEGIIIILEPSEKTKTWLSPKLRKDSKEFDKKLYENKIKNIIKGKNKIINQKMFEIIEAEYDPKTSLNFYILKRK